MEEEPLEDGEILLIRGEPGYGRDLSKRSPIVTGDGQTGWKPQAAPMGANSYIGWAALDLACIYIYALRVLSKIFRFLVKSCRTGRYPDLLQYYLFLATVRAPS